jgi:VRR-NUC domain.
MERMSAKDFLKSAPQKRKKNPETDIQNQVRSRLRANGWFVIRHQQGMGCHKGLSDLTAIRDGETVYIEIKIPHRGYLSENQKQFKSDIEGHGGKYIVARRFEDVDELCDREAARLF